MIIIARTPVAGYTPGQTINLEIRINNQSDQTLTEISVQLIKVNFFKQMFTFEKEFHSNITFQQINYFTHANSSRKKLEKIPIIDQNAHGCDANQEEVVRVNIGIPPIPPTDFSSSNIIKVKYMIRVSKTNAQCA